MLQYVMWMNSVCSASSSCASDIASFVKIGPSNTFDFWPFPVFRNIDSYTQFDNQQLAVLVLPTKLHEQILNGKDFSKICNNFMLNQYHTIILITKVSLWHIINRQQNSQPFLARVFLTVAGTSQLLHIHTCTVLVMYSSKHEFPLK